MYKFLICTRTYSVDFFLPSICFFVFFCFYSWSFYISVAGKNGGKKIYYVGTFPPSYVNLPK